MKSQARKIIVALMCFAITVALVPAASLVQPVEEAQAASKQKLELVVRQAVTGKVKVVVGDTYYLKAKATKGAKITYKTSKKSVVTVSNKGRLKGKSTGKATVTVKAKKGKKSATKKIKVTVVKESKYVPIKSITVKIGDKTFKSGKTGKLTIKPGESLKFKATINPSNSTYKDLNYNVENEDMVKITMSKTTANAGTITGKEIGLGTELWIDYGSDCRVAIDVVVKNEKATHQTLKFGTYEQDNNIANGKEAIEWIVLTKQDNKALVVSKYALDCKPYAKVEDGEDCTPEDSMWQNSYAREWLNSTFYDTAFSDADKEKILTTAVSADKNPEYSTDPGSATSDKVFLLSINEVKKYLSGNEFIHKINKRTTFIEVDDRCCWPTKYAIAQGVDINTADPDWNVTSCWWYLRTIGEAYSTACVGADGYLCYDGLDSSGTTTGIRPAMWITL